MKKLNKFRRLLSLLSDNGLRWTSYFILCYLFKHFIHFQHVVINALNRRMKSLEMRYKLPGDHSIARNYAMWQNYNWEKRGEEWTPSSEWKQSLIDEVMLKYMEPGKTILEVGPGAGRWSETLQKIARHLILVDLSDKCIELCKKRFSQYGNVEFFMNDGINLDFVPSETIDFIWSFDVFVHIRVDDTERYLIEFSRILKKGGRGIIHHAKEGGLHGGWRSNMTAELFLDMLKKHGLTLITQFDSWGNDERFNVCFYHDIITVFEK